MMKTMCNMTVILFDMSEVKRILEITPDRKVSKESFILGDFKCPVCMGRKQFHSEIGRDEIQSTDCSFCQGTGKLLCEVLLTWIPDETKIRSRSEG